MGVSIPNQVYGWAMVAIIWIMVIVFIFMYMDLHSQLVTCSTSEAQTCYTFTCPDSYETVTCGQYPYRCDDNNPGMVRCSSDPTKIVPIASADGDLCAAGSAFNRCKTTVGST